MKDRDERRRPDSDDPSELTTEELEDQVGEALPERHSMSVMHGDVTIPVDPAAAADVLAEEHDDLDTDVDDEAPPRE